MIMQKDRKGPTREQPPPTASEGRVGSAAAGRNTQLRSADMEAKMQERALRHASELLQSAPAGARLSPTQLAFSLKKEFDESYGPAWHCVVGKSFGSFITHSQGGFVYFSVGSLSFLLFRTEVQPVVHGSTFPAAKAR